MKESELKQLIKESDQLLKQIGWSAAQGKQVLIERYQKHSRILLESNEWSDWLQYLEHIKESDQLIKDSLLSVEQAREILIERYGKRSRCLLDANEWSDWLRYLQVEKRHIELLPSCREYELLALVEVEYIRLGWSDLQQKVYILKQTKRFGERFLTPQELKLWLEHLRSLPTNKKDDHLDRRPIINPHQKKGV